MSGLAVLEREIEKRAEETVAERPAVSEAARLHESQIHANYTRLLNGEGDSRVGNYAPAATASVKTYDAPVQEPYRAETYPSVFSRMDHVPAYQNPVSATSVYRTPEVPSDPENRTKSRFRAYNPIRPLSETLAREAEPQFAPVYDMVAAPVAPEAPVQSFVEAPVEAPVAKPAEAITENEEDALPTPRTMETIRRQEQQVAEETHATFLSALSTKTKLVLAAVAAIVVILFAVICVNTAIINSLNAGVAAREQQLMELTDEMNGINEEIGQLTSPENVDAWAAEHGMTR